MPRNTYYKTCLSCGAALDPGETCDCENEDRTAHMYKPERWELPAAAHNARQPGVLPFVKPSRYQALTPSALARQGNS